MKHAFKKIAAASLLCAGAFILTSCTSFDGPNDFVEYHIPNGAKTSTQSSLVNGQFDKYYVEEFTRDSKGNVIKVKQVEYIEKERANRKFIVWEMEWKVYGDSVVPYRMLCNGVEFCSIKWKLLNSQNKGLITQDIRSKYYVKTQRSMSTTYEFWRVDLEQYPIFAFMDDDKFVKKVSYFKYGSKYENNVLTLGYDNIVLTNYSFSYNKLASGISKTYPAYSYNRYRLENLNNRAEVNFDFTWATIADSPCMTKLAFSGDFGYAQSSFDVECTYNDRGNRKSEEWFVNHNSMSGKAKRIELFKQELTY